MKQKAFTVMLARRRMLGYSQAEVAERIGVTQPRISLWEARQADLPERRRAQIAALLEVEDPATLLDDF